jgi:hypothetical protein
MLIQVPRSIIGGANYNVNSVVLSKKTFLFSAIPCDMELVDMETSSFREEAVTGGHCVCHSKVSSPFGRVTPFVEWHHPAGYTYVYTMDGDFHRMVEGSENSYADVFRYFDDIKASIHIQFYCEPVWQGGSWGSMLRASLFKVSLEERNTVKYRYYLFGHVQCVLQNNGTITITNTQASGGTELREAGKVFLPLFLTQLGYRRPMTQKESSRWGEQLIRYIHDTITAKGNGNSITPVKVQLIPFEPRMAFVLEEPTLLLDKMPVSNNKYFVNAAMQDAYIKALERVPVMSDNNISNLMELVTFVYNIVVRHRIEIPKSLQDGWLSYRYVYNTTKADVKEAVSYVHRSMNLGDLGKGFSCHGESSFSFKGNRITLRCGLSAYEKGLNAFLDAWTSLYKYGLQPNFYVLWDLVPYSFIVDWLLPIGDTLSAYELIKNTSNRYRINNLWWSMKYTTVYRDIPYTVYSRWNDEPPALNGLYFFESNSGSTKRTICRILDVASLTIK